MSNLQRFMSANGITNQPNESPKPKPTMSAPGIAKEAAAAYDFQTKAKNQYDTFRCRINNDARAVMGGLWDKVKTPYKPKEIIDEKSSQWRTEVQRQEKMNMWMEAASKPKTGSIEEARYRVIMEMRNDSGFSTLAKKIPEPSKPASMRTPEPTPIPTPAPAPTPVEVPTSAPVPPPASRPTPPVSPSDSLKRKATGGKNAVKQEIIDLDEDEDVPEQAEQEQSDYEPEDDASLRREKRAAKRQRTGDFATQLQLSAHEEDLQFQLEEARLKGELQAVQIRRKMAALKRRTEEKKG